MTDTRFSDFDVCPSCYNTSISRTRYASMFKRAAPKPPNVSTRCDFSLIWTRMAWIWILFRDLPEVSVLSQVAFIQTPDGECPNPQNDDIVLEKPTANRMWFTIQDPSTHRLLDDWTICSHCKTAIETILPPFRGLLVPASPTPCSATCDLVPGSERQLQYIDKMYDFAADAMDKRIINLAPMAKYISEYANVAECAKDHAVNRPCHTIPGIPDFTVCPDCYHTIVLPTVQSGSQLARSMNATATYTQNWTCQLYSARMRQVWADATTSNDANFLRQKAVERKAKEREALMKVQQLKVQAEQANMQAQFHDQMALNQSKMAMNTALNMTMMGYGGVTDFSGSQATFGKAAEERMKMAKAQDEIKMVVNEWKSFWE
jgi:hypothetical protein